MDPAGAEEFRDQYYAETSPAARFDRMWQVRHEIATTGSYTHTLGLDTSSTTSGMA